MNEGDTLLTEIVKEPEEKLRKNFSGFYSDQYMCPTKTSINLLSLIHEPVTAPATVRCTV